MKPEARYSTGPIQARLLSNHNISASDPAAQGIIGDLGGVDRRHFPAT